MSEISPELKARFKKCRKRADVSVKWVALTFGLSQESWYASSARKRYIEAFCDFVEQCEEAFARDAANHVRAEGHVRTDLDEILKDFSKKELLLMEQFAIKLTQDERTDRKS